MAGKTGKFNYGGVDNPAWINDEDETNKQREQQQQQQQQQQHRRHHGKVGPTLSSPRPLRIVDRAGSLSRIVQHKKLSPTSSSSVASSGVLTLDDDDDGDDPVVDFDDMLPHVGEFGPYQIALFFLTAPFCFFLAFSYFSQVFITLVDVHTCHIPQLNRSGLNITQKYKIKSIKFSQIF